MELSQIKGLGEKAKSSLEKMGIFSVENLLETYPYRYEFLKPSNLLEDDETKTQVINIIIDSEPKVSYIRKNFNSMRFRAMVTNHLIWISIFNRAFLRQQLKINQEITVIGKYNKKKNLFTANDIKIQAIKVPKITPIYHSSKNIKNNQYEKWIQEALKLPIHIEDHIPKRIQENYNFIPKLRAIQIYHNPQSIEDIKKAKVRLIYEELFEFMFKILYLKQKEANAYGLKRNIDEKKIEEFITSLPFKLTNDQSLSIKEGIKDLKSEKRMNRLLLGDVGSGKTIVAMILMYANVLSGYQSVLMAPTEILATQHYATFTKLFGTSLRIVLLVGSMKAREKKEVIEKIQTGVVDIIIGTHTLLNEKITFANLGLVVTDEQHRFGVNQRKNLQNKGFKSDVLYLSATPIPRTYALTIYGDMDVSMIASKPNGRKKIITKIKKESEIKDVLKEIYKEIIQGHQIYIVSPLIEETDNEELKNVNILEEKFNLAFQNKVKIGVLHGKMKSEEKEHVMKEYEKGKIEILISTTVIEVGVDVKNATMIVIFNAERFGLATLHQLRGRVGRNDLQSYCYLISNQEIERLHVLEESNDGFYISEKDFELRGQGDLFGIQQSGDMSFKIADLKRDYKILLQAKKDALSFLEKQEFAKDNYYFEVTRQIDFTN